jgi:hypothetical protein
MTLCPTCGTDLSETDNFCGTCDTKNESTKVDLAQKHLGLGVHAALCVVFLPITGFFLTVFVSALASMIFSAKARPLDDLSQSPAFAIPIALGLVTGFYLNRRKVYPADLFAWSLPAVWFACYFFAEGPSRFAWLLSPPGPDCGECLEKFFFPIPLMFSLAYSVAALAQKMRIAGRTVKPLP